MRSQSNNATAEWLLDILNTSPIPHQKILVIDVLIAFKGSANLTLSGWRKAANGREFLEIVTNIDDVIDLNNRFFSPVWADLNNIHNEIEMVSEEDISFQAVSLLPNF